MKGREPEWAIAIQTKSVWNCQKCIKKSYPASEELPENPRFFECSEYSEMNFALTPTLGGYNQWICELDHSAAGHGSQPYISTCFNFTQVMIDILHDIYMALNSQLT